MLPCSRETKIETKENKENNKNKDDLEMASGKKKSQEEMQNYLLTHLLFDDDEDMVKKKEDSIENFLNELGDFELDPEYLEQVESADFEDELSKQIYKDAATREVRDPELIKKKLMPKSEYYYFKFL